MNRVQELVNDLRKNGLNNGAVLGHHSGVNDEIADLLERKIPKKLVDDYCPTCGRHLCSPRPHEYKGDNYCRQCGQALDWSEYKKKTRK